MESVCDHFETAWKTGGRPRIEDHVNLESMDTPTPEDRELLQQLAMVDLQYRWRASASAATEDAPYRADPLPQRPLLEHYITRYPSMGTVDELPESVIAEEYWARR